MGNMRFKVGDRVRIKSIDWYNKTKNEYGNIDCGNANFIPDMVVYCGEILTIRCVNEDLSYYYVDGCRYAFKDEMIEGLVEEETKPNITEEAKTYWDSIKDAWICPEGYIFKDENGNIINATKIVLEKKKKEYPKTYEECCKVLGVNPDNFLSIRNLYRDDGDEESTDYERDLLGKFDSLWELRICRDAYWKIAGEEMGLGKPWEPDWKNDEQGRYMIMVYENKLHKDKSIVGTNFILVFPTEEMRDAFYENFKSEIEICKELL